MVIGIEWVFKLKILGMESKCRYRFKFSQYCNPLFRLSQTMHTSSMAGLSEHHMGQHKILSADYRINFKNWTITIWNGHCMME